MNNDVIFILCSMWAAIAVIGWKDPGAGLLAVLCGLIPTVIGLIIL